MDSLAHNLQASLSPDPSVRRGAERALDASKAQPGFSMLVLQLAQDGNAQPAARQAAALLFKNFIRNGWAKDDEDTLIPVPDQDRAPLKAGIVQVMIQLANNPNLQVQVGEAIAVMAESDFPLEWGDLVNQLVGNFSQENFIVNNAVLQTAHAIFRRWRSQFRSDTLFTEIKYVLEIFCQPYLALFKRTDELLASPSALPSPADPKTLSRTLLLLLQLFYDLNSQDLPEFFEDNLEPFMALLHKYLTWSRPELASTDSADDGDDDEEAGPLEKIRASICEIAELYTQRYLDAFPMMDKFVETTWTLVTGLGPSVKYDILVSKAISFLSVSVRMPGKKGMFEGPGILEAFCEKIVLPNMVLRTFEEEMFEDDAFEYVRRDLLETAGEAETRRQSASDFTRALMDQFEARVTEIISRYIQAHLQQYASDPAANWKAKDTAVFLLTSIAARGSTAHAGVTSTNSLIDVVQFFSDHVVQDLQLPPAGAASKTHPIIVADAIKFLYTFRSQLTKEQLLSVIPMLSPHLQTDNFVIHTYAALTIERCLAIKQNNALVFTQADVRPFAESLLVALFTTIERGTTPEEISKNDYLMKCVMRTIITARQAMTPIYGTVLQHLMSITGEISKNPSNPKFNHYTFESISALVRFVVAGTPSTLAEFEAALFPPFQYILAQDVSEFSPFVFQILSQLLELHSGDSLPQTYQPLLQPILEATLWVNRGNIPALVRLLRAFLEKASGLIINNGYLDKIKDIVRFLVSSKANDPYGGELIEALFHYIPAENLQPYLRDFFVLLMTRLSQSKTEKFTQSFVRALMLPVALRKPGFGANEVIQQVNSLQPNLFVNMFQKILPDIQRTPVKDRKVVMIGLAVLLTQNTYMLNEGAAAWTPIFETFLKLFLLPQSLSNQAGTGADDEVTVLDLEETGYQASFSRLGASEPARRDPLPDIAEPGIFMARSLVECNRANPGRISPLVQAAPPELAQKFVAMASAEGLQIV